MAALRWSCANSVSVLRCADSVAGWGRGEANMFLLVDNFFFCLWGMLGWPSKDVVLSWPFWDDASVLTGDC